MNMESLALLTEVEKLKKKIAEMENDNEVEHRMLVERIKDFEDRITGKTEFTGDWPYKTIALEKFLAILEEAFERGRESMRKELES